MPRYTYNQSTSPNLIAIRNEILLSAMTDKSLEGVSWEEAEEELYVDMTNTLSVDDNNILDAIVAAHVDDDIIINQRKYYDSSDNSTVLQSDVWTQKVSLEFDLSSSEDYIIGYCAEVVSGINYEIEIRIQLDDTTELSSSEIRNNKWQSFSGFINQTITIGSHTVDLDFRSSNANKSVQIKNARIYAIRI